MLIGGYICLDSSEEYPSYLKSIRHDKLSRKHNLEIHLSRRFCLAPYQMTFFIKCVNNLPDPCTRIETINRILAVEICPNIILHIELEQRQGERRVEAINYRVKSRRVISASASLSLVLIFSGWSCFCSTHLQQFVSSFASLCIFHSELSILINIGNDF